MSQDAPTIFIVDDDPALRKALSRLLRSDGYEVAGFDSAQTFLAAYNADLPGCLVLDVAMPGIDGLALQRFLSARRSMLPVVFLTGRGDIPSSVQAMKDGAVDFLTKPVDDRRLLAAVRQALERNRTLRHERTELSEIERRLNSLTPRERMVLEHVVAGELNKQVASDLGTVEKTIKVHRGRVMEKMQARSLAELVRLSERGGVRPAQSDPAIRVSGKA